MMSLMNKTRLIFLPEAPDDPAPTLTLDEAGRVMTRASLRPDQTNLPDLARDILVVPGVETTAHRMSLPMRSLKQARATAAMLLEDSLAAPGAATHLALGEVDVDGGRMVVAVSDARLRGWLAQAARLGVSPTVITPGYALLPEPDDDGLIAAVIHPGEFSVRGQAFAAAVEPELIDALVAGRPLRMIDDPAEREGMLARGAAAPAVNLLQGSYDLAVSPSPRLSDYRLAMILACIVILSPLVLWGVQIVRDRWTVASQEAAAVAIADRWAPATSRDIPAGERLKMRLGELERGERFLRAAAVLYAVVEQTPGASIANLFYGSNGQVRATIAHANYSDAASMKTAAALYGFSLVEDATSTEGGRVMTDIVLEAQP
jgi:general secretion pathway protein L